MFSRSDIILLFFMAATSLPCCDALKPKSSASLSDVPGCHGLAQVSSCSVVALTRVSVLRHRQETELEIEEEIDILMSSDIVSAQMSTKSITFSRAQQGWFFRSDRKVSRRTRDMSLCGTEGNTFCCLSSRNRYGVVILFNYAISI